MVGNSFQQVSNCNCVLISQKPLEKQLLDDYSKPFMKNMKALLLLEVLFIEIILYGMAVHYFLNRFHFHLTILEKFHQFYAIEKKFQLCNLKLL